MRGVEPGFGQLGDHDGDGVATIHPPGSAHVNGGQAGVEGLAFPGRGTAHARGAGGRDEAHHVGEAQVGKGAQHLRGETAGVAGFGVLGHQPVPAGVVPAPVVAPSDGQAVSHWSQGRSGAGTQRRTGRPGLERGGRASGG